MKSLLTLTLPLSLVVFLNPAFGAAKQVTLVEDAKAVATIVTAAKPSENARKAAAELQYYVRKITGAELPIATDDSPSPPSGERAGVRGPLILVGPSKLTADLKIPSGLTPQLREEGFLLQCHGDRLIVAGNDGGPYFGTRYAVVSGDDQPITVA